MKAMACAVATTIALLLWNVPVSAHDPGTEVAKFFLEKLLLDPAWDLVSGTAEKEQHLQARLKALEENSALKSEVRDEIRKLRSAVNDRVSREEFQKLVQQMFSDLSGIQKQLADQAERLEKLEVENEDLRNGTRTAQDGNTFIRRGDQQIQADNLKRAVACYNVAIQINPTGTPAIEARARLKEIELRARLNLPQAAFSSIKGDKAYSMVYRYLFHPDGTKLATCGSSGIVKFWDVQGGKAVKQLCDLRSVFSNKEKDLYGLAFSPNGRWVAYGGVTQKLYLQEISAEAKIQQPQELIGHTEAIREIAFSPDSKLIASGAMDGHVWIWDVESKKDIHLLTGHNKAIWSLVWSPDGKRLATCSYDKTAHIWDVQTGKELMLLTGHEDGVTSMTMSPDGTLLATRSDDGTCRLWDLTTGKTRAILRGFGGARSRVVFSPDGKILLGGGEAGDARLWNTETGYLITELKGHKGNVFSVAFSPDGKTIATGGADNSVRLWDTASKRELGTIKGHSSEVSWLEFSPNGKTLASHAFFWVIITDVSR